jgi:hypothetical protein
MGTSFWYIPNFSVILQSLTKSCVLEKGIIPFLSQRQSYSFYIIRSKKKLRKNEKK